MVVERRRPVVLRHHFAVHRRGPDDGDRARSPLLDGGTAGRRGAAARPGGPAGRRTTRPPRSLARWARRGPAPALPHARGGPSSSRLLDDDELLPAIVFIFSRAACDDAVRQCLRDGLRLTDRRAAQADPPDRRGPHRAGLSDDDLRVLGYGEWLEGLEAGMAAHHAGLVPAFRETVEECFAAGLLQVVFATETLSLGINMPARTVVIERFDKFGGAGRATLTSGEYAQLTGRAGRRGLDDEGHAVVLWSRRRSPSPRWPGWPRRPPPDLRSAFRPTYNLAVNLVRRFDRPTAADGPAPVLRPVAGRGRRPPARRPGATAWSSTWAAGWPSWRSSATWTAGG